MSGDHFYGRWYGLAVETLGAMMALTVLRSVWHAFLRVEIGGETYDERRDRMAQMTGDRSHRGFYRKTADISGSAAESIAKWGFTVEVQRQTACIAFSKDQFDDGGLSFYWHPVAKKFRVRGVAEWTKLPPGKGVVALMLHLHGKTLLRDPFNNTDIPHFGAYA